LRVADAHTDLLVELTFRAREENPFGRRWLPGLRAGGVGLQVCPIFAADAGSGEAVVARARAQAEAFQRAVAENADDVVHVCAGSDVGFADRLGLVLALEGAEALDGAVSGLDWFWARGLRVVGLTWNEANVFASGISTPEAGLTRLGRALVGEVCGRGGIVDLAHASARTLFDVLEVAPEGRVIVSHANCQAVFRTRRNLSDDQLSALAAHGGLVGVSADGYLVDPQDPTLRRLVDHFDHALEVMGEAHVGLGGDFLHQVMASGALDATALRRVARRFRGYRGALAGLAGPQDYPQLVEALRARGYEPGTLERILSGNLERLLRAMLPQAVVDPA